MCLELMRSDETNFIKGSELEARNTWQQVCHCSPDEPFESHHWILMMRLLL